MVARSFAAPWYFRTRKKARCVRYWFKSPVVHLPEDILVKQAPWASDIFALRAEMPRLPGQEPSTPILSFDTWCVAYNARLSRVVSPLRVLGTSLERMLPLPSRVTVRGSPSSCRMFDSLNVLPRRCHHCPDDIFFRRHVEATQSNIPDLCIKTMRFHLSPVDEARSPSTVSFLLCRSRSVPRWNATTAHALSYLSYSKCKPRFRSWSIAPGTLRAVLCAGICG